MGPAVFSIVVAAIGAILRFATNVHSATWNVRTIGDILMIVGMFGFVWAVVSWAYWDGWGFGPRARARSTTIIGNARQPVYGPDGYARTTYDAGYPMGPTAAGVDPLDPTRPVGTVVEDEERSVF